MKLTRHARKSHYDILEAEFLPFYHRLCESLSIQPSHAVNNGIISAHGDKCYSAQSEWADQGLKFEHGVAIYLLTYIDPWAGEVGETSHGWVPHHQWVVDNAHRFLPYFKNDS